MWFHNCVLNPLILTHLALLRFVRRCADCDLINLGTYSLGSYHDIGNKVSVALFGGVCVEDSDMGLTMCVCVYVCVCVCGVYE